MRKTMTAKRRLPIETFDIPIHKIRRGYYSAVYFWREKQILEDLDYQKEVLMQVFQKRDAVLCGTDEAIAVLKLCNGYYRDPEQAYERFDEYVTLGRMIRKLISDPKKIDQKLNWEINMLSYTPTTKDMRNMNTNKKLSWSSY